MAQRTDLKLDSAPQGAMSSESALILAAVAEHFTATNPTDTLEQHSLLIAFGAETYRLTQGKPGAGAQRLAAAAFALAPTPAPGVTRGEYALILRRTVAEAGHDWPDGDNDPAIPRIVGVPGPRTEPTPTPIRAPRPRPAQDKGGVV